jgi:putative tricarboxylic transport membrane protein
MRPLDWQKLALAAGFLAFGVMAMVFTFRIPTTPLYAQVGPKAVPFAISLGILLLGAAMLWQAWRGTWGGAEPDHGEVDYPSVVWLALGLGLNLFLIKPLGFVIASTLLFVCIARAFGSRRPLRDLLVGTLVAGAAYVGFDRLLGINIGAGVLEGLI